QQHADQRLPADPAATRDADEGDEQEGDAVAQRPESLAEVVAEAADQARYGRRREEGACVQRERAAPDKPGDQEGKAGGENQQVAPDEVLRREPRDEQEHAVDED